MEDPRSVFTPGKDAKVVVSFEWEGPLGPHHFEGLWKGPEGKIMLISDFRYEAKGPRFNGYWSMLLSDTTPPGEWQLEARIDGEPAGVHSFVLSGSAAPRSTTPQALSSAELYQKALDASVTVEKLTADGTLLGKGSGFWIADGRLLTSFAVIDGASTLRISLRNGSSLTTDQVVAWNRWQDWALLKIEGGAKAWLKPGSSAVANVGDRCVFLEVTPAGARLADGSITGKNTFPKAGDRLLVASGITTASFGGPLLDEYGNYVGILGGSIIPGGEPIKTLSLLTDPGATLRTTDWDTTGLAVPKALLPELPAGSVSTGLAELASRGEFTPPIVKTKVIQYATLSTPAGKVSPNGIIARSYQQVFSRRDAKAEVSVTWQAVRKEKVNCMVRVFNSDNKVISESKPREVSMGEGKFLSTNWDISIAGTSPGIYRIDLLINDKTAWRDFFRITE
jgi:S1-C subfamily serine protease